MQEFRISVPVNGFINLSITAESVQDAVEILFEQQNTLENIPNGHLNFEIDKIIVIPVEPKTFN